MPADLSAYESDGPADHAALVFTYDATVKPAFDAALIAALFAAHGTAIFAPIKSAVLPTVWCPIHTALKSAHGASHLQ